MTEEDKDKQTAVVDEPQVEPNEAATADSDAAQEGDGLDELLREFDERRAAQTKPEQNQNIDTEPKGQEPQLDVAALATLERRLNEQEAREHRRELEKVFTGLTDGVQADEVDAEAYLNARALRDPRLNQAYQDRNSNPQRWNKVFGELKKDFQKRYGKKVDKQVTESREAVASAVRSASTAAPQKEFSAKEITTMSKQEWDDLQRKLGVTPV